MNIEDRKRIITNFIKDHPDCKAEEIVQGISDKMSRALVFRYLPELIKENIVLDNSKNRRDHKFSINNNNLLLEVQDELDNFKKVFFQLIQKTETIAKNKNYSIISNEIGLSVEEPKKWTNIDYQKFVSGSLEMLAKGKDVYRKNKSLLDENITKIKNLSKPLKDLENKLNDLSLENKLNFINKIIFTLDELMKTYNQRIAIINNNIFTYKKFVSAYDTFIILGDTLSIFQYVFDLFFYRSIIWSCTVPKEMLLKLNDLIFNSFIDIQNKLTKFISHIFSDFKLTNVLEIFLQELKISKKIDEIFASDQDGIFYYNYKVIGLENEIKNVIASILPMCKETKKYGILSPKLTNQKENFFAKEEILKHLAYLKDLQQQLKSLIRNRQDII